MESLEANSMETVSHTPTVSINIWVAHSLGLRCARRNAVNILEQNEVYIT